MTTNSRVSDKMRSAAIDRQLVTPTCRFTHGEMRRLAQTYGCPLYVYDGDRIRQKFHRFKEAFCGRYPKVKVHYALKANTNLSIVSLLKHAGAEAECISMGEIKIALQLGFRGEEILFTSSSKSPEELEFAVNSGVVINLDSLGDLDNLIEITNHVQRRVRVSFRVNPDVDPKTHRHIATGHKFTKFGILLAGDEVVEAYRRVRDCDMLDPVGIHSHVGSQILYLEPFQRNTQLLVEAVKRIKRELDIDLQFINVGGGLGIPYRDTDQAPDPDVLAETVTTLIKSELESVMPLPELWLEPGRHFVGDAGILLSRINSVKHTPHTNFINIDTGFNHQPRPILYEAHHRVRILGRDTPRMLYDIAGNICETGDIVAEDRELPTPEVGDILAILDSGAYGFSMASEYNSFLLPAEILALGDRIEVIRKRASFEDLLRNQILLDDLG